MTEEEFEKLPEISYSGPAPDRDTFSDVGANEDKDKDEQAPNERDEEDVEIGGVKAAAEETGGLGAVSSSLHDASSALEESPEEKLVIAPISVAASSTASLKSQDVQAESEEATQSKEAASNVEDSPSQTADKSDFGRTWERLLASSVGSVSGFLGSENPVQTTPGTTEDTLQAPADSEIPTSNESADNEVPAIGDPPGQAEEPTDEAMEAMGPNFTKSTICSICIDEFEPGEKLTVLPRCRHAFHKDCIHPWLTERQGCCPFCKTDVVASTQETDSDDSPDNSGVPTHVDIEAPSVDERRPHEILGSRWSHPSPNRL
jgi:hypothetical protein